MKDLKLFNRRRLLIFLTSAVVVFSFTYLTYERNKVWQNDITLWKDVTEKAPDNARAFNNLGRAYGANGRELEAIEAFKKAVELLPNYALAYMNMAVSFSRLDMTSEAEFYYKRAIYFYPGLPEIYYNYGFFLYSKKRYKEAFQVLNRYLQLDPVGPFVPFVNRLLAQIENKNG